jgi:hypothetical protein
MTQKKHLFLKKEKKKFVSMFEQQSKDHKFRQIIVTLSFIPSLSHPSLSLSLSLTPLSLSPLSLSLSLPSSLLLSLNLFQLKNPLIYLSNS